MIARPVFPGHDHFWFETLRVLGHTAYAGADIGEVLTVAGTSRPETPTVGMRAGPRWPTASTRSRRRVGAPDTPSAPATDSCARPATTGSPTFFCTLKRATHASGSATSAASNASPHTRPSRNTPLSRSVSRTKTHSYTAGSPRSTKERAHGRYFCYITGSTARRRKCSSLADLPAPSAASTPSSSTVRGNRLP